MIETILPETFVFPRERIDLVHTDIPLISSVSSFGFGGTNAHVIIEASQTVPTYKDIRWSTNTFPIEYHNTQDVKSNPIIFDRISTHNVKSQERLFVVGKLPSNIDVTNITYEVYTTQNTNMAHITHALRFYCDSRNYIYSSEIDVKTIQNLKDIRYLPSCPSIVDTIEDFTNKHKTNSNMCHIRKTQNITDTTDCLVVGAGITGLLVAEELTKLGKSVVVLERSNDVGGVWNFQANKTSRVNTSEPAYRLIEKDKWNMDHTPTQDFMEDVRTLYQNLCHKVAFHFQTNVTKVDTEKQDKYTVVHYTSANQNNTSIKAQRVFMCVNRRLGSVRRVEYNNESQFKGHICYGVQDDVKDLNWKDKTVLILGAGAFRNRKCANRFRVQCEKGDSIKSASW